MPFQKIMEYSLPGVKVLFLDKFIDERGSFMEVLREDWKEFLESDKIVQINASMMYPGIVKAWHKHTRGQVDYFFVVKGSLKICAYDDNSKDLVEIIASEEKPAVVRIPGHYWHGVKAVGSEQVLYVYFVTRLYDYKNPDELRRPWNDPSIVPQSINGSNKDPRAGKPWDWMHPPHK